MLRFFRRRPCLIFAGPAVLLMAAMTVYPMIYGARLSLMRYNLARPWIPRSFVGLRNFSDFIGDLYLHQALLTTLKFSLSTVSLQLAAGLLVALLIRKQLEKGGLLPFVVMLPMMMVPVVTGIVWRLMLNDSFGVVNWIIQQMGGSPKIWLGPDTALAMIVLVETWQWLPFSILLFSVGMSAIPNAYYEASAVDGAGAWDQFVHITLPNLKWTILIIVIFKFSDAIKAFDVIYALTGGGPGIRTRTLALYIQNVGFSDFEMGYAMALSVLILFISVVVITPILIKLQDNESV